jgi:hypothetical protein
LDPNASPPAPAPGEQQSPEQAAQLQRLEAWNAKGLGAYPFIDSKEDFDALPATGKAELTARFPEHVEYLIADQSKLPAELRLRMAKRQLLFTDQEALEAAGFVNAVAFLSKAQRQCMSEMWEKRVEAEREQAKVEAKAREEEFERMRIAGMERTTQSLRAAYLRKLHAGSGVQ